MGNTSNNKTNKKSIAVVTIVVLIILVALCLAFYCCSTQAKRGLDTGITKTINNICDNIYYNINVSNNKKYFNEKYFTIAAATDLTGPEIVKLAKQHNYNFNSKFNGWSSNETNAINMIKHGSHNLDASNLENLDYIGALCNTMGVINITNNDDINECFNLVSQDINVVDKFNKNTEILAIVESQNSSPFLVFCMSFNKSEQKSIVVEVFSEYSVESGFVDEYTNGNFGNSIADVWKSYTGRECTYKK